ncbi:MAG: glycoside hydrolase family 65 protein [Clostridiaceae bacterium]|jgi:hypothetical glycosyl hydrolase|nr:glycoside hydrolase family 65 protein [Clostridiaceae bacterium]
MGHNEAVPDRNWIVEEKSFSGRYLGKSEVLMALGNGYMGIRSANEESYAGEKRNTFIAGTFNRFDENEMPELPNAADLINLDIELDGEVFDLKSGQIIFYSKSLNLKTGELTRKITWVSPGGKKYDLLFRRFVSRDNLHIIGQRVEIKAVDSDSGIRLMSGINGQMTNSGVQHFSEGEKRLFDNKYLQLVQTTTQSEIDFVFNTTHNFETDSGPAELEPLVLIGRRIIKVCYSYNLKKGERFAVEKISNIHTSRDKGNENKTLEELRSMSLAELITASAAGYSKLFQKSADIWADDWKHFDINIKGENDFDQLAVRFAIYHLTIMTPAHDNRMNIAAKGLTGEGYKGHTFWDTEIFMLPFWIYSKPEVARSLLEYRYLSLPGAHRKAKGNGYKGAMFPWESAWLEDGEVTPEWGSADVVTGKPIKIWTGFIEQHISADIAYAVWHYYSITGDQDFMDKYGYRLIVEIAVFWASRLEYNECDQKYHINDVIGPDEYKEHVNNNAYTNYMAAWTIKKAMEYYEDLSKNRPELFKTLNNEIGLDDVYKDWSDRINKIYLPKPGPDLVIPQDDTYLEKEVIDLTRYKNQEHPGMILRELSIKRVNEIQVSKQADVLLLLYLLEDKFDKNVKKANWYYYEPKTLHDSSLSLSTHCILACDLGDMDKAYDLFRQATCIDLGPNMLSSEEGIHAASLGGMWQCVVNGFGGLRTPGGKLMIDPHLPKQWNQLEFSVIWRNDRIRIATDNKTLFIKKETKNNPVIEIEVRNRKYLLKDQLNINIYDNN